MRYISILILFSVSIQAQKLQVLDAENGKPLFNARIIIQDQILYTNDDGFAPVESTAANIEVSAVGYNKVNLALYKSTIKLKPSVRELDEVKIRSVDLKSLFEDLHQNYNKRYYDKPSVYDITYKSKSFNNDQLFFMVITEAKLWTKSNSYNYKDGIRKKYDDILQIQLNNVKYKKEAKSDALFNAKTNDFNHADMGDYFFSFEVSRILGNMKLKESKSSGKILAEDGDEQLIKVKVKSENGIIIEGEFKYNKADKAITFFSMNYQQAGYKPYNRTNTDGKEFQYQLGDVLVTYEFYKKNGTYLPSMKRKEGSKFYVIYEDKKDERKAVTEIIYNTFRESTKKGLENRVDFSKSIWENILVKDDKENTILLSKEEQEFVDRM
ncbi:hypothetical protein SAMN05421796_103218 [Chryseobacterium piscicola]|uniref:CarboxypepD_reg-like domain-containing protein n=2 Tax=Chryseobacterium TaxID=59732 RepID=A0A1N7LZ31_9FLAO|nr:hypothetical protein [Chryseobacterium piscicola]PQA94828.1 hypothetical protein B0A70_06890 [Chryseobacterium piscicola]SIS79100.1 hypothetical protein SAMN05421796_103218 [Chryseobacterium piscicola]